MSRNSLQVLLEYQQQNCWRCDNCFCMILLHEEQCLSRMHNRNLESALPRQEEFDFAGPRDTADVAMRTSTVKSTSCFIPPMSQSSLQPLPKYRQKNSGRCDRCFRQCLHCTSSHDMEPALTQSGRVKEAIPPHRSVSRSPVEDSSSRRSFCTRAGFHLFLLGTILDSTSHVYRFSGHKEILAMIRAFVVEPSLKIILANQLENSWRCTVCLSHNKNCLAQCAACGTLPVKKWYDPLFLTHFGIF